MTILSKFYSKYQTRIATNAEAEYVLSEDQEQKYFDIELDSNTTDLILFEKTEVSSLHVATFLLRDRDNERDLVLKLAELAETAGNDKEKLLDLIWEKREELPEFN